MFLEVKGNSVVLLGVMEMHLKCTGNVLPLATEGITSTERKKEGNVLKTSFLSGCAKAGCSWTGPRANLYDHLAIACKHFLCENREAGCTWEGKKKEIPRHEEICEFSLVECVHSPEVCPSPLTLTLETFTTSPFSFAS